jgi:hypothetical protein
MFLLLYEVLPQEATESETNLGYIRRTPQLSARDGPSTRRHMYEFSVGIMAGVGLMWLYRSERARDEARRRLDRAPDWLHKLRRTAVSSAVTGAQRVSEAVDSAPLPPTVKHAASDAAFNLWAAGDALTEQSSEGPNGGNARPEAAT